MSFNKIFAKLGSDMKKPDAITVITEDNFREKVWPLPASDMIYVGRATSRKLEKYGIYTIGGIAATPPETMRRWFGVNGLALWKTYPKLLGKHEHRQIVETLLGRPLKTGEVVHHLDGNKHNNDPENLVALPSQSVHCKAHDFGKKKGR